jgi:fumarate hydratase subunit beta
MVIGSAGPTTSSRMDPFSEIMLSLGINAMMGKGRRDETTKKLLVKYKAIYFATFGGAGAYLSKRIKYSRIISFDDIGPEAFYELLVDDFPAVVAIDSKGDDIYEVKF